MGSFIASGDYSGFVSWRDASAQAYSRTLTENEYYLLHVSWDGTNETYTLNDEELDELFSVWAQPEVIELINQVGDIDNPIPLGIKMLKEIPEFRRLATKGATAFIWG